MGPPRWALPAPRFFDGGFPPKAATFPAINKVSQNQIERVEPKSPKGKFHPFRRHLSLAFGGSKDTAGNEDRLYYIIADDAPADIGEYPDSGKRFIKPQWKAFKLAEVDYYQGED